MPWGEAALAVGLPLAVAYDRVGAERLELFWGKCKGVPWTGLGQAQRISHEAKGGCATLWVDGSGSHGMLCSGQLPHHITVRVCQLAGGQWQAHRRIFARRSVPYLKAMYVASSRSRWPMYCAPYCTVPGGNRDRSTWGRGGGKVGWGGVGGLKQRGERAE